MEKRFVNLTPHEVFLVPAAGGELHVPPSGSLARCDTERRVVDTIEVEGVRIPITMVMLGEIEGLPAPEEGTIYIVSLHAALRAARDGRVDDILVSDETIRDEKGRIIGCRSLARQEARG